MLRASTLLLFLALAVAACSATPGTSVLPSASASSPVSSSSATPPPASPSTAPSAGTGSGDVIVTFRTAGDEEFRILLTDPEEIRTAERLLSGEEEDALFPSGRVLRSGDGDVNTGYSWHIDPESVEFAQMSTEVCDGRPSGVEDRTITSDFFCPWTAVVVGIQPAD